VHYINDIERGYVWEESIIYSVPEVRFLALSATIPNAQEFSDGISAIKGHKVRTVVATKRNVPLQHQFFDYELGITTLKKIREAKSIPGYHDVFRRRGKGRDRRRDNEPDHVDLIKELGMDKLPCLFFTFSRRDTQEKAKQLSRTGIFRKNGEIAKIMSQHLQNVPSDVNKLKSTILMKEVLPRGIAFHHAGLLPVIKEMVEDLFARGLIKVLYATETFAVGINMPAKTVCFAALRKYDGIGFRMLNTKEYFQIAGRAGRRGMDKVGYVVSMIHRPTFNYDEIKRLTTKDIEPIKSQFKLSVNTILNLVDKHTQEEIEHILRLSFFSYQKFGKNYANVPTKKLMARYNSVCKKLQKLHFVEGKSLTDKGRFSSKIFADEITMGEIFATDFVKGLSEYQILLILASLAYEPRRMNKFKKTFINTEYSKLVEKINKHPYLSREKKFENLKLITVFVKPVYDGKTMFDVLALTNLLEGDLIRIYGQIIDKAGQIKKSTGDYVIREMMKNCEGIVKRALEGVYDFG